MKMLWLVLLFSLTAASRADVFEHPLQDNPAHRRALQELTLQIQQQGAVAGEFVQTKHMQMLTRPIVTRGTFALTQQEFIWKIEHPFAIHYQFAAQKLVRDMDGKSQTVEPSTEPMLYGFFSFFSSLFNLSEQSLEKLFVIYYLPTESKIKNNQDDIKDWVLGLKPKQASLARSLKQLHIYGSATHILKVRLVEQNNDYTELEFSYPQLLAPSTP